MKENCKGCNTDQYIVNRTKMLCQCCNHFRIHGESIQETQRKQQQKWIDKAAQKPKKPPKPTKIYVIKQSTSKTAKKNQELSELKFSISEKALLEGEYYCKGCGCSNGGLDRSHILSEKQRPDLSLVEENIDLLCRDCHMDWESWSIIRMVKLICFEKYLEYIYKMDEETFFKIFTKMEEVVDLPESILDEKIFNKIVTIVKKYFKKFT